MLKKLLNQLFVFRYERVPDIDASAPLEFGAFDNIKSALKRLKLATFCLFLVGKETAVIVSRLSLLQSHPHVEKVVIRSLEKSH